MDIIEVCAYALLLWFCSFARSVVIGVLQLGTPVNMVCGLASCTTESRFQRYVCRPIGKNCLVLQSSLRTSVRV